MRRTYPYLQSPYHLDLNEYDLKNKFFQKIDQMVIHKQYVRITLLDWKENPIKEIQGELSAGGQMTKDGSSSVRRTCNLSCSVNGGSYNIDDADMDFAINKKMFLEFGVENLTGEYPEYPILWFPQGVFFISSFTYSTNVTSAVLLNITLKDKMCMLNGEIGGKFPAMTIFDEMYTQLPSGENVTKKVLIYDIIKELVNHFGGEDLNNIVIEDVPLKIRSVVKWIGSTPLYLIDQGGKEGVLPSLNPPDDQNQKGGTNEKKDSEETDSGLRSSSYEYGNDCGYIYTDFTYPSELMGNAGETVCSILDQIKNTLGNYEYFYDEFGIFHFREIKNYMNTTKATEVLDKMEDSDKEESDKTEDPNEIKMTENDYLVDISTGKSAFTFTDNENLVSLNYSPKYENIKNDYIVQGTRKSSDGKISFDVRYHLAIDNKPRPPYAVRNNFYVYTDQNTKLRVGAFPQRVDELKEVGNSNLIYAYGDAFYQWNGTSYTVIEDGVMYNEYQPKDWRTELYLQGLDAKALGRDAGYYFAELEANWPMIYDIENHRFHEDKSSYNYYLDFIDPALSPVGQFSVSNIGRRTNVNINDDINCIFAPQIPDVVFIETLNKTEEEIRKEKQDMLSQGYVPAQTPAYIYNNLATGGYANPALEQIKYDLYVHTTYQKAASVTAVPAYYLEPNTRVTLRDASTNTYGDFMVNQVTLPFGPNSLMSFNCSEVFERY